tara:strand:- start:2782 stop:3726 length:945 start_codon:yes stop_codon:yes gene_type:complete
MRIKKPKFWDYQKPNILAYIMIPFTLPIRLNNFILKLKKKRINKKIKLICVGNIYVGGTGKTPTTLFLYKILKELNFNIVTGKKFYSSHLDEIEILNQNSDLILETNRKKVIKQATDKNKDIIIFDDGLQDRSINYDYQFVCFDTLTWIGNGFLLPSGPLREKLESLKKYDAVFLKNSDDSFKEKEKIIKEYNPSIKIFETYYTLANLKKFNLSKDYLIFSGIGNPQSFKNILKKNNFNIVDEIIYTDHKNYTQNDIDYIIKRSRELNAEIITTEKDFVKISKINKNDINYVEIKLNVINEKDLIKYLKEIIND